MSWGVSVRNAVGLGLGGVPSVLNAPPYAPSWTPAKLTTALWLDGADASTITLNGSTVSQWRDKSGNGNSAVQATSVAQPIYSSTSVNNKPGITFDGVNDYLTLGNGINLSNQHIVIMVARYISGFARFICKWQPVTPFAWMLAPANTVAANRYLVGNSGVSKISSFSQNATIPTIPAIYGGSLDSGSLSAQLNGTVGATTITGVVAPDNTSNTVVMGNQYVGATDWSAYAVTEVIICDGTQATLETRQKLEGYLAWKWGGF